MEYRLKANRAGKTFHFNWDSFNEEFEVVPREQASFYTKDEAEKIAETMENKFYTYLIELEDEVGITQDSVGKFSKRFNKRLAIRNAAPVKKTLFKLNSSILLKKKL